MPATSYRILVSQNDEPVIPAEVVIERVYSFRRRPVKGRNALSLLEIPTADVDRIEGPEAFRHARRKGGQLVLRFHIGQCIMRPQEGRAIQIEKVRVEAQRFGFWAAGE